MDHTPMENHKNTGQAGAAEVCNHSVGGDGWVGMPQHKKRTNPLFTLKMRNSSIPLPSIRASPCGTINVILGLCNTWKYPEYFRARGRILQSFQEIISKTSHVRPIEADAFPTPTRFPQAQLSISESLSTYPTHILWDVMDTPGTFCSGLFTHKKRKLNNIIKFLPMPFYWGAWFSKMESVEKEKVSHVSFPMLGTCSRSMRLSRVCHSLVNVQANVADTASGRD
ncbi:hypothetical protein AAG570_013860 [Ranatra chinensis]|uniref:Uncharacterized protein n=1 Tax=Ranatra chinensis TaxID=642074 RepID=A0ABD0YDE3_9HEMI